MAATYRGSLSGSTGARVGAAIALCVSAAGCASTPTEADPARTTMYAFIERGPGQPPAVMRQEADGTWRIERGVLEGGQRRTPRWTLLAFIDAFERRDYAALRLLAPADLRDGMTPAELKQHVEADPDGAADLLDRLKAHVDSPMKVEGAAAEMRYAGARFELRYEDGAWVVVDPD